MGLNKREKGADQQQGTSTFFAAAEPKADDQKPKAAPAKPPAEAHKTPARTFLDSGPVDPIHSLSTHRTLKGSGMTEAEREARKEAQEQRARRGLEWMMSVLTR
jgi:hypothetical protein